MVTPVWHLQLRTCDFIGKFSANGTRVEIRKLVRPFAPRCQWTLGNQIFQHTVQTWKSGTEDHLHKCDIGQFGDLTIRRWWSQIFYTKKLCFWNALKTLTPAPAAVVASKPLISRNSWTDRARELVETSLDLGDRNVSNENDKNIPLHLTFLRKIYICAFAVLNFWQNFEKIQTHVPRNPFSLSDPVFALRRPPEYSKTGFFREKSDRAILGGKNRGSKSVGQVNWLIGSCFGVQKTKYRG